MDLQVIGVDIGTQSTKGCLMDSRGKILATSSYSYTFETPKRSWAQQWACIWTKACFSVLKQLANNSNFNKDKLQAITVSSLYGGSGIPVDENIKPIGPCLIWMDRRSSSQCEHLKSTIDEERLLDITGNGIDSYYGFTKILWIKENLPDLWKNTAYFLPPNTYINYLLTGEIAIDHSAACNIGGVYNIKDRKWSKEASDMVGIPIRVLPDKLVCSDSIIGTLKPDMAEYLNLPSNVPIISGGIDAAVATLAAGVLKPASHVAMIGTSMCWGFIGSKYDYHKGLVSMPYVADSLDKNYIFGGATSAGACVSWIMQQLFEQVDDSKYLDLESKALDIPAGSNGLLFIPYMMGERSPIWDDKASGVFLGLNLSTKKEHLFRSVLEGVSFALQHNIDVITSSDNNVELDDDIIVVGGAARSNLWMQIISDITNRNVYTLPMDIEAPLGGCLLSAKATGILKSWEMPSWHSLKHKASPIQENVIHYRKMFNMYKSVYPDLRKYMYELGNQKDKHFIIDTIRSTHIVNA